jgi:hypothetical protein
VVAGAEGQVALSEGLILIVTLEFDRPAPTGRLSLRPAQKTIAVQPVGYPAPKAP